MTKYTHHYKNRTGDCSGLAVADAINATFNVLIPKYDVEALYERKNWGKRGGRLQDVLTALKHGEQLAGFKVKDFKIIYFDGSPENPAYAVRQAMNNPNTSLLMSLWIREQAHGKPKIQLDEDYNFVPYETPTKSTHAIFLKEYDFMPDKHVPIGIRAHNNWGPDWGLSGDFFISFPQFHTECCQLFEVEFETV